jgi:hypothetical protein
LINARSLKNKSLQLDLLLSENLYDVICVTETWLDDSILDCSLTKDYDYTLLRKDRKTLGGGVCIFAKTYLNCTIVKLPEQFSNLECLVLDTHSRKSRFRLVLCYNPPSHDINVSKTLSNFVKWSCDIDYPLFIVGDFNLPNIHWGKNIIPTDKCSHVFWKTVVSLGLTQLVTQPTRENNILDLVLTPFPNLCSSIKMLPPFSLSCDHNQICFDLLVCNYTAPNLNTPNFNRGDYISFSNYLNQFDWETTFSGCITVNSFYKQFLDIINMGISNFIPIYGRKTNRKSYPKNIKKLQREKLDLWRKLKTDNSDTNKNAYKTVCHNITREIYNHECITERNLITTNSKNNFYKFMASRLQHRKLIPPLSFGNNLNISDSEKANAFNLCFAESFTEDDKKVPDFSLSKKPSSNISTVNITTHDIRSAILNLKLSNSSGPDGLPAILIKKALRLNSHTTTKNLPGIIANRNHPRYMAGSNCYTHIQKR